MGAGCGGRPVLQGGSMEVRPGTAALPALCPPRHAGEHRQLRDAPRAPRSLVLQGIAPATCSPKPKPPFRSCPKPAGTSSTLAAASSTLAGHSSGPSGHSSGTSRQSSGTSRQSSGSSRQSFGTSRQSSGSSRQSSGSSRQSSGSSRQSSGSSRQSSGPPGHVVRVFRTVVRAFRTVQRTRGTVLVFRLQPRPGPYGGRPNSSGVGPMSRCRPRAPPSTTSQALANPASTGPCL
ncbi:MAG: hypothetical protein RL153_2336 [Verrucomicrobiota bacterium]